MALAGKDFLGLEDASTEDIRSILDTAEVTKQIFDRPIKKFPTLRGRVVANLFYEPSTRTRTSFELAGKWLSADVVNIAASTSSVAKGESLTDTARTLEALGVDLVVIRHASAGAPHLVAQSIRAGVVNAGDGAHEHPTQALLDLFTINEKLGHIDGLNVAIIGDIVHSRVARSNIWGLVKLGARVTLCGPPTLLPDEFKELGVDITYDLDEALARADVVNILRIQLERQKLGLFPSAREYSRLYGITSERIKNLRHDVLIMHPGPANLGVEVTKEVAESERAVITEQVTNGVAVRMALLYLLLGGKRDELAD